MPSPALPSGPWFFFTPERYVDYSIVDNSGASSSKALGIGWKPIAGDAALRCAVVPAPSVFGRTCLSYGEAQGLLVVFLFQTNRVSLPSSLRRLTVAFVTPLVSRTAHKLQLPVVSRTSDN